MSKKILSVALALIFVISTFAVSAFAVGGAAFEEDAEAYTQAWRLEDLGETDGTYSVGVYLETNYNVGAIQFQIANDDENAVLEGVDSEIFAAPDFDVQWTEDGLVFIVPTPVDSGATAVDATTEILVATLSYTLKDGASSATLAIVDDVKSEANPGGSLIAVRMSDDNLVTGTMIYGQTATVEEGITIGAAAAPAEIALTATGTTDGVVIDTTITDELKEEGYLREILSKVQNMRKDKGFEVLDKINLYVSENSMLEEVIKKFEDTIKHDTLATNIIYNEERESYTETPINGEKLNIDVEVIK